MFDIGFWELCLVGLVSLLVIGPENLPKAARIAGFWVGKTRNMVASVKAEIKQELQAEELRQIMQQQAELEKAMSEGEKHLEALNNDVTQSVRDIEKTHD
ncbi:Sec-independent protein translocase protein TatB [methane-oxidizing endosymbiont of Gigantopelta aegis]|uniref:Sec-independent protein translocase protein TatB n=1 Tax=methane-oxidizing endosymbiont of Gigantopelta aegis TaxID=2794938 RepID=UPI0018DD4208|nr:Sec-independent protein translocase protein TatB [methane-oxidizing endosymbiont of Gigantopelta aegis]